MEGLMVRATAMEKVSAARESSAETGSQRDGLSTKDINAFLFVTFASAVVIVASVHCFLGDTPYRTRRLKSR